MLKCLTRTAKHLIFREFYTVKVTDDVLISQRIWRVSQ
ncbi:hypothetical protein GPLA_4293 [Paraglaciecola polaris LMG 21857]|uniref:Uncharacterized protein n=1 Tax=Paraglaciecola polaris LMG 21857 TaxID=1129793 RepID=K6ZY60_9ALTE|nr:hypothetical protein GPLA_4293 [Paraglaciecola polaris LMG 21857]